MFFLHGTLTDDDPNWQQFNGLCFLSGKSSPEFTVNHHDFPTKKTGIPRVNEMDFWGWFHGTAMTLTEANSTNSWAPPKVGSGVSEVWV